MLAFVLPTSILVATALWAWLDLLQIFALPFLVIAAWLLLRFHVPPEGHRELKVTSLPHSRALFIGLGLYLCSPILLPGLLWLLVWLLGLLGVGKDTAGAIVCVPLVATLPPVFYWIYKSDKRQRNVDKQAAELAEVRWHQGEGAA